MKLAPAVLILSLSIAPTQFAQTNDKDKCRVEGQVLNSVTGLPVRKAAVTLFDVSGLDQAAAASSSAQGKTVRENPATLTDAEGRFVFAGLEPGSYGLSAERSGYRSQSYGIPWAGGNNEPVKLTAGDARTGLAIKLMPLGTITGRVVDEDGDPIRNVSVSAQVYVPTPDGRKLEARGSGSTNDLGEYRIFDLQPRKYFLKAEPIGRQQFGSGSIKKNVEWFVTAYYPGSQEERGAQPLDLTPGRQLQGVDFTLHKGHLMTLHGRVIVPEGAANVTVFLGQRHEGGSSSSMFDAKADGSFQMLGLDPGDYVVGARCMVDGKRYEAYTPLLVGTADITDLEIRPEHPLNITGRLRIEGTASAKPSNIVVALGAKLGFSQGSGNVHDDGTFSVRDVPRDIYAVDLQNIPGMFVKSIRLGNADISETGLDLTNASGDAEIAIVLSARAATVEGRVVNEKGEPAAHAMVALIAADSASGSSEKRNRWPRGGAGSDTAGHFEINDVVPGSYRLYAWQRSQEDSGRMDPDYLKANEPQSASVEIAEGEHKSVEVKLMPRRPEEQ